MSTTDSEVLATVRPLAVSGALSTNVQTLCVARGFLHITALTAKTIRLRVTSTSGTVTIGEGTRPLQFNIKKIG